MTFKEVCEYFPRGDTYVGDYGEEGTFTVKPGADVTFGPEDEYPVLEWDDKGAIPFVVYEPDADTFYCMYYAYFPVQGYINESGEPDDFYPATNDESFGWELIDPEFGEDTIFTPDDELAAELGYEGQEYSRNFRREQVAYNYDIEAYMDGRIFTTYEALNKFLRERNK